MEVAAKSNSKRMYSWWWDSHNTPKNSKWLQENLADMDSNVKKMIKVLEEDADSFARRAEMYYRKRPELMQLVEEFYRAYRALAERYNHATGVIHKAHETIAEAFPSQVPLIFGDESNDVDPQTPGMLPPFRARFDPDEIKRNIDFSEEAQFVSNGKARKGLNFNDDVKSQALSESERASKAEAEVMALKDLISRMEVEKEASLAQFEKDLEKLSNLESEMTRAQEESRGFNHRAVVAEAEMKTLRENLEKLESDYQKCLQNIAEAGEISERVNKAESETRSLKESLAKAEARLRQAEEDSRIINERAEKSGVEVEKLKQTISKLIEDKEASEFQYQQCLNLIAELKLKLYYAQEETKKLNSEIEDGAAKLKFSEEKCVVLERSNQNLHSELDTLLEKLGNQSEKLTEKQTEVVKLWSCVQEERLRFQEAETAFQTLQQLHSQSQEELNNLGLELETRSQIMKDIEIRNNELNEEIQQAKVEYKELNLSSVASVSSLKETVRKLEAEVEVRVNQRSALQQEINFLKEELSQVKTKHESMVESVGSSLKELQEFIEREKGEKMALFEKLETMEKLIQRNLLLEKSITDLNFELETIREKLKTLEEDAHESVTEEKSSLAIENIVLVESLRQLNSEAIGIATEKKSLVEELKEIKSEKVKKSESELWESQAATFLISTVQETLITHELAEACKNLESKDLDIEEKLKRRNQDSIVLLNQSIKSLEDYVFANRKSDDKIADSETGDMSLRIKAVSEAIIEKEKLLMLENSNAYSMLEDALKQIKELKLGASGRRSTRKVQEGGGSGKTRKPSHHEIEMVTKDIVLDQTSDGSSYEIINKRHDLELDYNHSFVELKPVKTRDKGKSVSEESLVIDKLEIFDRFMDPNREVNEKRKVIERLDSDLRKLENLQITVDDLKSKVGGGTEKVDEYETIKGQLQEAEEAIEKLFNVNRKLMTKAESSEKEISSGDRRRRITEQARRGSEKIGRLQLELQRIQFLLVKLDGEKKENRARSKISDSSKKVLLRDYIYGGGNRSVSMKKKTKKRSAFCGCVQQPRSP